MFLITRLAQLAIVSRNQTAFSFLFGDSETNEKRVWLCDTKLTRLQSDNYSLIFTCCARIQCYYFWPIMHNIMLLRKLVSHFIPSCGFITILQKIEDCFKILPNMLALCLMLSETYYAQNYSCIIGLGLLELNNKKDIILILGYSYSITYIPLKPYFKAIYSVIYLISGSPG